MMSNSPEVEQLEEVKSFSSQINPFAITNTKTLHSEIDISTDLIEPKLELPDYSEEDTTNDNSHSFLDANDVQNSFASISGNFRTDLVVSFLTKLSICFNFYIPGGMEIIPGTSGIADATQDTQQGKF